MSKSVWSGVVIIAVGVSSSGCDLLTMSPEKACEKANQQAAKPGGSTDATEKARCVAEFTSLKKNDPKRYACTTKCIKQSTATDETDTCVKARCGDSSSATASAAGADDGRTYPVDELTSASLKSKVLSEYRHYGIDILNEKDNGAGWSATVALGKKASFGEARVYKVVLFDVTGQKQGYELISKLKKSGVAEESRVGKKKALYVQCLFRRDSNQSGTPRECTASDSKIGSFTDDIAPL